MFKILYKIFDRPAVKQVFNFILTILWREYMKGGNEHHFLIVFKSYVVQKIFRINAKTNWPVHVTSVITSPQKIHRGTRTPGLSPGCHIDGRNGIFFEENVWVGPNVKIISMNHNICRYDKYIKEEPVRIGKNCWIGAGSIILPGVELGEHTVVGAGAVVTKKFTGSNQLIAGNPARFIKRIKPYDSPEWRR